LKSIHVLRSHFWKSLLVQRKLPSVHPVPPVAGLGAGVPGEGLGEGLGEGTVGGGVEGGRGWPAGFDGDPVGEGPGLGDGGTPWLRSLTVISPVMPFWQSPAEVEMSG
jgi:hypothetical protein